MKNGLLSLKNRPALLKCSNNIHIFAYFPLLKKRKNSLIQLKSFDSIPLMQRVESDISRQNIRFSSDIFGLGDKLLANSSSTLGYEFAGLSLFEGISDHRDLGVEGEIVEEGDIGMLGMAFAFVLIGAGMLLNFGWFDPFIPEDGWEGRIINFLGIVNHLIRRKSTSVMTWLTFLSSFS